MKEIKIRRIVYSPGYCDMLGACHGRTLEKTDAGWVLVCRDREEHSLPTVVTTCEVSAESVLRFEEFLAKKKVLGLEKRPKSDDFITDYSPWSYGVDYYTKSFGKTVRRHCGISEYKKYSKRDIALLKELNERFAALQGRKLSEVTEEDG